MFPRPVKALRMGVALAIGACTFIASFCIHAGAVNVARGDTAGVCFTCRLESGDVVVSTSRGIPDDPSVKISRVFVTRDRDVPVEIEVGTVPKGLEDPLKRGFEGEVIYQLSRSMAGVPVGEKQERQLSAERLPGTKEQHMLKIARVRKRPREMRFTPENYKARTGRAAEIGRSFTIDPAFPGQVVSVTDEEVLVCFTPPSASKVTTAFGEGFVALFDDHYEIAIEATPGSLVRSGGLVGRIVKVDGEFISIDYGHPFGGEVLFCDVLVEWMKPSGEGRSTE